MAEAEHFIAQGRGNGLPFCTIRLDVSGQTLQGDIYDWITLSGWSKDNPEIDNPEASKRLSLQHAVRLYWNLNGFTGSYEEFDSVNTGGGGNSGVPFFDEVTADLDAGNYYTVNRSSETLFEGDPSFTKVTPKDRQCLTAFGGEEFGSVGSDTYGGADADMNVEWRISAVIAMYDGPVDNEDNFVGYGLEPDALLVNGPFSFPHLYMGSYVVVDTSVGEVFDSGKQYSGYFGSRIVDYVEQAGIHFMGDYRTFSTSTEGGGASVSITSSEDGVVGRFEDVRQTTTLVAESILKDLDFYTYPDP